MGFVKATCKQSALKIGLYGPPGTGKTLTALLIAEGISNESGGRIAYFDTEPGGTDFYSMASPGRKVHPDGFDFDVYRDDRGRKSRSLAEIHRAVRDLNPERYTVIVIDSISHLWDAIKQKAKPGKGLSQWPALKRPFKELIFDLLNCPQHVIVCGRSSVIRDEKMQPLGTKMSAEGDTEYELSMVFEMSQTPSPGKPALISAFCKKDRTGVHGGKTIQFPNYQSMAAPVMGLLSAAHDQMPSEMDTNERDRELESESHRKSAAILTEFTDRCRQAKTVEEVNAIASELSASDRRRELTHDHMEMLRLVFKAGRANPGRASKPAPKTLGDL